MTIRSPESEHSPLSAFDEYPIHQIPAPIRVVETTDARAYERYWFAAQDMNGEFMLQVGMGFYPNLGTVDAFVVWNHNHQHTTVRAHRYLNDSRAEIECGPFHFDVIEPFRQWRLRLDDNEHGVTFDLRYHDEKRAVFQLMAKPWGGTSGRPATSTAGYETFGTIEGTVGVDGQTFDLQRGQTRGSRDHHWGTRNGVGGPKHVEDEGRGGHFGQWVEFSDWSIWLDRCLYNIGDDANPGTLKVVRVERALKFDPETNHFIGGIVTNHLANGDVKEIHYEQIDDKVLYQRTALYMGPDYLGTPDGNYFQGVDLGDGLTARVDYDISDPKTRIRLGGFDDHLVRATCDGEETIGLIEVKNPVAYEWASRGINGYRMLD